MQVGDLVRYQHKYPDGMEIYWIGMVIDCEIDSVGRIVPHVQWNNGLRQWRYDMRELEIICK
tara:strand:+ start:288 stop:473 length:186 start_codon:yes stop_codon:yes gene_type:complete